MDFNAVTMALSYILKGMKYTLIISVSSIIIASILGILIWQLLVSKSKFLRALALIYSKLFRCVPFMIQAYIVYYSLPTLGIKLSAEIVGIICLSLYNAAYVGMILESGMRSIPKGQFEATKALNISKLKTVIRIILPQMISIVMPPLSGQFITAVKDSSVLSVITVCEMTMMANQVINYTFSPFEVYIVLALAYWLINIIIERISKFMEKRASKKNVKAG